MLIEISFLSVGIFLLIILAAFFIGRYLKNKEIKENRLDAINRSRAVLSGSFSEQLAPYLPGFKYSPTECRFLGKPIDLLVFKGLDSKEIEEVVFLEVKSGKSKLNSNEKSLKKAIEEGRVRFEEYRVEEGLVRDD